MRTKKENISKKRAAFKAAKKTKWSKNKHNKNSYDESDEEEVNFVRKLKRGHGKYKGKFPFKCFECGRVGQFASKCPYKGSRDSDNEEYLNHKEQRIRHQYDMSEIRKKFLKLRKSLYSKENNSSSEEDNSDDNPREVLFMEIVEYLQNKNS